MKHVSGRRMCEVLSERGWSLIRISGNHHVYTRSGPPRQIVVVPVHGNKDLRPGDAAGNYEDCRIDG